MTNPYLEFVQGHARLKEQGRRMPLGGLPDAPRPPLPPDAPLAMIFSPHPDDECITGALPLRLRRQGGWRIVNVAVTLGSNPARREARWRELSAACGFLGFEVILSRQPMGLEKISPRGRGDDPANWRHAVETIAALLRERRPRLIVFPHESDWNGTHIGVHHLVREALESLEPEFETLTVETEYWAPMDDPNLMIESSVDDVADLVAAISFHAGEVLRNPYHLSLPAWMQDNVRRGSELVGGQGAAAPDFLFATLYRMRRWAEGGWRAVLGRGRFLAAAEPLVLP